MAICGAGEIHTRARAKFRGDPTRRERPICGAPFSWGLEISRARVCISPAPQVRDYSQSIPTFTRFSPFYQETNVRNFMIFLLFLLICDRTFLRMRLCMAYKYPFARTIPPDGMTSAVKIYWIGLFVLKSTHRPLFAGGFEADTALHDQSFQLTSLRSQQSCFPRKEHGYTQFFVLSLYELVAI